MKEIRACPYCKFVVRGCPVISGRGTDCSAYQPNKYIDELLNEIVAQATRAAVAEEALLVLCYQEADNDCPGGYDIEKCKKCEEDDLCCNDYAANCYFEKYKSEAKARLEEKK